MPPRLPILLASGFLLLAALAACLLCRNSPAQIAQRYLLKLAKTATVYSQDSPMNRRLRAPRLGDLLSDPLEIHVPNAGVDDSFGQEELLSGYLSLIPDKGYLQVTFTELKLTGITPATLRGTARLILLSDSGESVFPFDEIVTLEIQRNGKRLLLSRVASP